MLKLKINKPGIFFSIDKLGSFHSPFELQFPDSLKGLVETELIKNGIRNYLFEIDTPVTKVKQESVKELKSFITEAKKELSKEVENKNLDLSEVLKKLDDLQSLVYKVIQKAEPGSAMTKQPEIEEEIFIPRLSEKISVVDLSVKTTKKDDIDSRVNLLSTMNK